MPENPHPHPAGQVLLPAAAIGSLSILLAVGLSLLGLLARADRLVAAWMAQGKDAGFPKALPEWVPWLATLTFSYGLALAILSVAGTWRRVILWITTLVLVAAWAPVLSLAAHAPRVTAPLVAVLWSGFCALIYAGNHLMTSDATPEKLPTDTIS